MSGAIGYVVGGDTGNGKAGGAIGDISGSEPCCKGSGGTTGSSSSILGGSKGSNWECDRGGSGDGSGCGHQAEAEAVGDKRTTHQASDLWSKLQTEEAPGEQDDAGGGAGKDRQ